MGLYLRPSTLADALAALADPKLNPPGLQNDRLTLLAGGTDFYPAQTARRAWLEKSPQNVLDIWGIDGLRGMHRNSDGGTSFGALTTWTDIAQAALPPAFDALKSAAREVGGRQVQNRGTIAGNICNASPAADGVPPLLALDARVEIASVRGARTLPLADFITGNRRTGLAPDELVTAVHVPPQSDAARSLFLKLGARSYLLISIVSVAAVVSCGGDGRVSEAAIAVGACSAVPTRLAGLEAQMRGRTLREIEPLIAPIAAKALSPIDDVRGTAAYRHHAAAVLLRRALAGLIPAPSRAAA